MATVKKLISLDEGIAKELDLVAAALHKSQREIVESALDFYFDYTDGLMADRVTAQIKSGEMKTHDAKSVYAQLGLDL
jgi:predicted DNA-binding protein